MIPGGATNRRRDTLRAGGPSINTFQNKGYSIMNTIKHALLAALAAAPLLAGTATAQWALTGNSISGTDFLGTTNAQDFRIRTNNTERMRITTTGLVGIGTTSPTQHLQVFLHSAPQIRLQQASTDSWEMWAGADFHLSKVSNSAEWLTCNSGSNFMDIGPNDEIHINTSLNRTGIGTTSPVSTLTVAGNVTPSTDRGGDLGSASVRWNQIWACNGTINTSDAREKENIHNIDYGLDAVMRLRPVSFTWKENVEEGTKLGLIAQELEQVIPEVVKTSSEGAKGVYYSDLIPVLTRALQQQQEHAETNAASHAALHADGDRQAERLAALEAALGVRNDRVAVTLSDAGSGALRVDYTIPSSIERAEVVTFDVTRGAETERTALVARGEGSTGIAVANHTPGTYLVTVVADGKLVGSRKVVVE